MCFLISLSTNAQARPGNEAMPESGPVETERTGSVAAALLCSKSAVTSAVPTGKPLTHGQHSGSLAAVIVLQLSGIVYDLQYAASLMPV